jgi:hypothetical protein
LLGTFPAFRYWCNANRSLIVIVFDLSRLTLSIPSWSRRSGWASTSVGIQKPDGCGKIIKVSPFFTIGHSTRQIDEFVELLNASQVGLVVDVRAIPRSRTNPQYNRDTLPKTLSGFQIAYEYIAELGGRRTHAQDIPPSINGYWENQSFHNYADYAMGSSFHLGFAKLRQLGRTRRCTVMCAEVVWWRCHRRIIADYLLAAGETVFHILGPGAVNPASLTPAAIPHPDGTLTYPAKRESGAA